MKHLFSCLLLSMLVLNAFSQESLRLMSYNLYRFPVAPPYSRATLLKDILDSYQPDLLMVCELVNENGANQILDKALNYNGNKYARSQFVFTQSDTTDPLHQMAFYNKEKLSLIKQNTYPTSVRDINHFSFQLNTKDRNTDPVFLDAFVVHLKSSDGATERNLRRGMVDTIFRHIDTIPQDHFIVIGGDFNFYDAANEWAYQKLTDTTNPFVIVDPIHAAGKWHDNDSFQAIHTQATRISTSGFGTGGAGGGMDDRFDYIMMSKNMESSNILRYVPESYKAYGNNGNCFNNRVDAYDCEGMYPLALRQNLYNMSDHLPVVMSLQTNKYFEPVAIHTVTPGKVTLASGNIIEDFLELDFPEQDKAFNTYLIADCLGQIIKTKSECNKNKLIIDCRNLRTGIYYLHCTGRYNLRIKFIKR